MKRAILLFVAASAVVAAGESRRENVGSWFEFWCEGYSVSFWHDGLINQLFLQDEGKSADLLGGNSPFPDLRFSDGENDYALKYAERPIEVLEGGEKSLMRIRAVPATAGGKAGPWTVTVGYEMHPEGAIFIDMECVLTRGAFKLEQAAVSFKVNEAVRQLPKYRDTQQTFDVNGFPTARFAFGAGADSSYTNEVEIMVEENKPMAGATSYSNENGKFTWVLGNGGETLTAPYTYRNRIAIGLAHAPSGKPRSNVVGQRVYHWVNFLDLENWYPSNETIDAMVAKHATMLIMHMEWMLQRGSNGKPHADYRVVRNHDDMVRCIDYAHQKGLRVGVYMRGIEPYALDAEFFPKYLKRNWDGLYVDWHGPMGRSWHETRYEPETQLGDTHHDPEGRILPAKEYFEFTKRLRGIVGPEGFLIGHQGSFTSGIFANLLFDAFLPGETGSDQKMFANRDEACYRGMQGGMICMPWTLDLTAYRSAEGMAKMAAWGFYPHIVMGIKARRGEGYTFTLDPNDEHYAFILPYWRVLSAIDVDKAAAYNLPSHSNRAVKSDNEAIECAVYKTEDGTILVIAANLGEEQAKAELTLNADVLGTTGTYRVTRIDAATGAREPRGETNGVIATAELPQWGIEGLLLEPQDDEERP